MTGAAPTRREGQKEAFVGPWDAMENVLGHFFTPICPPLRLEALFCFGSPRVTPSFLPRTRASSSASLSLFPAATVTPSPKPAQSKLGTARLGRSSRGFSARAGAPPKPGQGGKLGGGLGRADRRKKWKKEGKEGRKKCEK